MIDFEAAARLATEEMRQVFEPTPLQRNDYLSEKYGCDLYLKREDLSPVRSYKIRGAFNAMRKQRTRNPDQRSFVCASAGNHAQGFAYVCKHFGVLGEVFMPITTPQQKIEKTRAFGGENIKIRLTGDYFDQTLASAQAHCTATNAHFLAPFDDLDVIEGQASVAVEVMEALAVAPDMVVLPVGGGGLSAGMTKFMALTCPDTAFRYVEPEGGASLAAAIVAGQPTTLSHVDTFVDGAAVARIGDHTFAELAHVQPSQIMSAPEDRICTTILELLNIEGIVLEPAGALVLDVLETTRPKLHGKTVVCVTSGGNFDFERLPEVKERAMRYAGTKKYLILRMPQRPGALREFLDLLGPEDDIARFEYLKKSARNFGTVLIGIETGEPSRFEALFSQMTEAGFEHRDITNDPVLAEFLI